ncbi:MAG: GNAT family N-acetyltransferase, partial [Pseudomonadota bacterium]
MLRRTDELLIRELAATDVDALFDTVSASLPTLSQWLPWAKPGYARSDSAAWIAHCQRTWSAGTGYHLGIFDAASGILHGGVGFSDVNTMRRSANLGYWVADAARGREVAVAAARLAAAWAFEELGLQRIEILVHPQSAVHGLVQYADGSLLAQLGSPDMRTPIAHALAWPSRMPAARLNASVAQRK